MIPQTLSSEQVYSSLFIEVPTAALDVMPSPGALIVYCHLMFMRIGDTNTTPPISLDTLAATCRISKRSVSRHIRALQAANLIVVNSGGNGRGDCNSYTFTDENAYSARSESGEWRGAE